LSHSGRHQQPPTAVREFAVPLPRLTGRAGLLLPGAKFELGGRSGKNYERKNGPHARHPKRKKHLPPLFPGRGPTTGPGGQNRGNFRGEPLDDTTDAGPIPRFFYGPGFPSRFPADKKRWGDRRGKRKGRRKAGGRNPTGGCAAEPRRVRTSAGPYS